MRKLFLQIKALFRNQDSRSIHEPISHRLNPQPILPQNMMKSIAPAYEEALAREKKDSES